MEMDYKQFCQVEKSVEWRNQLILVFLPMLYGQFHVRVKVASGLHVACCMLHVACCMFYQNTAKCP